MSILAAIVTALLGGGSLGAVIAFALKLDDARRAQMAAAVDRADTDAELKITRASLDTTNRLLAAEKERSNAYDDELAALEKELAVPGAVAGARDRVMRRWKAANAHLSDAAATGGGATVSAESAPAPARSGDAPKA